MDSQNLNGMEVFSFTTDRIEFKSEDGNDYIIGYVSTHDRDLVDDVVTKDCMMDMLSQFKAGKLKLDLEHETLRGDNEHDKKLNIAKVPLAVSVDGLYDGKGLIVKYKMNKEYKKLDSKGDVVYNYEQVKSMIKENMLDSFSIAFITAKEVFRKAYDGVKERLLDKINWINTALTGSPINKSAGMLDVMLKSLDRVESKPFGEYDSFDDCVNKNKDKNDPEAYCATIQRQVEGKKDHAHANGMLKYKVGGSMTDTEKKTLEVKSDEEQPKEEPQEHPKEETQEEKSHDSKDSAEAVSLKDFNEMKSKVESMKGEIEKANKVISELKAQLDKPVHSHKAEDSDANSFEAERKAYEKLDPIQLI